MTNAVAAGIVACRKAEGNRPLQAKNGQVGLAISLKSDRRREDRAVEKNVRGFLSRLI